ncbi:hypothetical protein [Roseovarius pacificus]|uniref:hypothetical protein n=1 Tax=Roseovarius pacificus TaxID=337701 RepID=UPI0040393874
MKIIFNKKIYDTDQAKEITSVRHATPNNLAWFLEDLYRSRNGAWFNGIPIITISMMIKKNMRMRRIA